MKIALGTLKDRGEELSLFLEARVGTKPELSGAVIEIDDEKVRKGIAPRQVKTYIKRFLFMKGVRKDYRVFVEGKELSIWELEGGDEEEEEEEKAKKVREEKEERAAKEAEAEPTESEEPKEEEKKPKKEVKKASKKKPATKAPKKAVKKKKEGTKPK